MGVGWRIQSQLRTCDHLYIEIPQLPMTCAIKTDTSLFLSAQLFTPTIQPTFNQVVLMFYEGISIIDKLSGKEWCDQH